MQSFFFLFARYLAKRAKERDLYVLILAFDSLVYS